MYLILIFLYTKASVVHAVISTHACSNINFVVYFNFDLVPDFQNAKSFGSTLGFIEYLKFEDLNIGNNIDDSTMFIIYLQLE